MRILMASENVFLSVQGEGSLTGLPMVFLRLGGCSVGCPGCDTNYEPNRRDDVQELAKTARRVAGSVTWASVTGGEPLDHPEFPTLVNALREQMFDVAVATSGSRPLAGCKPDWVSVSPHSADDLAIKEGDELKVVVGLNDFWPEDTWLREAAKGFASRWVMPLMVKGPGGWAARPDSVHRCFEIVRRMNDWRMGAQAHRVWGMP